jgi:hypothetical protein
LDQAKQVAGEGTSGASNWVAHNEKMVECLKKTIAVHYNPEIADATAVQV